MSNINQGGVTITNGTMEKQILFNAQHAVAVPIILSGNGAVAAGTPITGNMAARNTAMTVAGENDTAVGVLLQSRVATNGGVNAQLLVHGFVNMDALTTETKALVTANVVAALPMIQFMYEN